MISAKWSKARVSSGLVPAEKKLALYRDWKDNGNQKARAALINSCNRLVVKIASEFLPNCRYPITLDDLIGEGMIGLVMAVDRWEPERAALTTYASFWIRAKILKAVEKAGSFNLTTPVQRKLFWGFAKIGARLEQSGIRATPASIAKKAGCKESDVMVVALNRHAGRGMVPVLGLQDAGDDEFHRELSDDKETAEETLSRLEYETRTVASVRDAVASLNPRLREIVRRRWMNRNNETLEAIGASMGITRERVRQLEEFAIREIKTRMAGNKVRRKAPRKKQECKRIDLSSLPWAGNTNSALSRMSGYSIQTIRRHRPVSIPTPRAHKKSAAAVTCV